MFVFWFYKVSLLVHLIAEKKYYRSSSSRPVKCPSSSIRCNCQKIFSQMRRHKTILQIRKKNLLVINNSIIDKFFKDFTNHRTKTNKDLAVNLSPTLLNTGTTYKTFQNKTASDTYWRVQLVYLKVQDHSSLEPPTGYIQE